MVVQAPNVKGGCGGARLHHPPELEQVNNTRPLHHGLLYCLGLESYPTFSLLHLLKQSPHIVARVLGPGAIYLACLSFLTNHTLKITTTAGMDGKEDPERADALEQFKNKLLELREMEAKLKTLRLDIKTLQKDFDTTEDNIKALQSVGQIIGEVLKQLDEERCKNLPLQLSS